MLVAGIVILLLIVGMFLQALTMSPRRDVEWQMDTEDEFPTTPHAAGTNSSPIAA